MRKEKTALAAARIRAGLKQSNVAHHLGVTSPTICVWESGKQRVPAERLRQMLELYGVEDPTPYLVFQSKGPGRPRKEGTR